MLNKLNELIMMGTISICKGYIEEGKRNYLEAIDSYKEVLREDSNNIDIYISLGYIYSSLGALDIKEGDIEKGEINYLESIKNCLKVLKIDPESKMVNICLGNTYSSLGSLYVKKRDIEKAKKYYFEAAKNYKRAKENHLELENIYSGLGNVYLKLGNLYVEKRDIEKAKKYYFGAVKNYKKIGTINYKNKFASSLLGNIYSILGDLYIKNKDIEGGKKYYLKAAKNYEEAVNINFEDKLLNNDLENILLDLKNISFKLEDTCIRLGNIYKILGILDKKEQQKNYLKAINIYEKVINLTGDSKKLLFYFGETLIKYLKMEKGKEETIKYLKKLNKIKKEDIENHKNYNQPIEKFIKNKCYILINNLKKIDFLNNEVKSYLKLEILKAFEKEFKLKIKSLKNIDKNYKENYYMYKTIDKKLVSDLNENRMWKGKAEYFNDPFDPYYKKFPTLINEKLNEIRISCFTEDYDNLLMWSHYGDNHKGICFGYKITNIHMDDLTFFEKVIYEELKTKIESDDTIKLLEEIKEELLTISEVYLRKHKNWEYEKEWRLINLDYKENYYYNMKISEVYFGIDCNEEDKKLIMKLLKFNEEFGENIEYYRMKQGDNLSLKEQRIKLNDTGQIVDVSDEK